MRKIQVFILAMANGMFLAACSASSPQPVAARSVASQAPAPLPKIAPNTAPIVETQAGDVQGFVENNVFAFKGIPYAAPPVGDLRWREPQPAAPWQGVLKANAYGHACIQMPGLSAANGGDPGPLSEDCLYLSIWTPHSDPSARLPVMVWIHGGAYTFGAGGMLI